MSCKGTVQNGVLASSPLAVSFSGATILNFADIYSVTIQMAKHARSWQSKDCYMLSLG